MNQTENTEIVDQILRDELEAIFARANLDGRVFHQYINGGTVEGSWLEHFAFGVNRADVLDSAATQILVRALANQNASRIASFSSVYERYSGEPLSANDLKFHTATVALDDGTVREIHDIWRDCAQLDSRWGWPYRRGTAHGRRRTRRRISYVSQLKLAIGRGSLYETPARVPTEAVP